MEEKYYTVNEIAERFQVSRKAVYDWMREGRLKFVLVGSHRRVSQSALAEFVRPGVPEDVEESDQKKLAPIPA